MYCLNPNCPKPLVTHTSNFCVSCGTRLLLDNRYRATSFLGAGGMGRNFLALDERTPSKKRCVIKQFSPQAYILNNPTAFQKAVELFNREAATLDQLGDRSPQIPRLLAYLEQDQRLYFVQEFIDGQNLLQELEQHSTYNETQIHQLLQDLLPVLKFIHEQGVIHRDIKPENIMRRQDGQVVLIDFGISRELSGTVIPMGTTVGTVGYAPPEQMTYGIAEPGSDIYALGATCIHLLTGVPPQYLFNFEEKRWLWQDVLASRGLSVGRLGEILDKMLKLELTERWRSPDEILAQLQPTTALIVSKIGAADYRTIAEAIKNAQTGTRILVRPGFYQESLVIDKALEIIGDGQLADITVQSQDLPCIWMQTDYAVVRNLTLDGQVPLLEDGDFRDSTVYITQGKLVLENCDITSQTGAGITIEGGKTNPIIRQCKIHDGKSTGVLVHENGQGTVEDCDIFANALAGVYITQGGNPVVRKCRIHDGKSAGVVVCENGQGTVEDCDIFANAYSGVEIKQGGNPVVRKCRIHDGKSGGVFVWENGQGTVEDCDIFANALAGVEITQGGNPVVRKCRIHDGKSAGVVVCENGQGTVEDCDIFANALVGVGIVQGGNPVVRKCRIHDGKLPGVAVYENGQGTVEDCDIFANAESGVEIAQGGNPVVRKCRIHDGKSTGVFVQENGQGTVEDCDIFANANSGVEIRQGGNPVIQSCKINRNKDYAVNVHSRGAGTVENCDLTGNAQGAWYIGWWCSVRRSGNNEG